MKSMIPIAIVLMSLSPLPVFAQSASRRIPASYALGQHSTPLQEIGLWTGYGLSVSFIPSGESIQKVWLDDPSQVSLDFDAPGCVGGVSPPSTCQSVGSMVIHLRRIAPIQFLHLLQSQGSTTLKVITQTQNQQRRLYQFRLALKTGTPEYVTVEIVPDRHSESVSEQSQRTQWLATFQAGVRIAEQRGQLLHQQPLWKRIQTFITAVRNGMEIEQAAAKSGISLMLVNQLVEMGREQDEAKL